MSAEAKNMLALGESGRYEFKQDADAVYPKTLAALANWVALDSEREVAHLLIGVREEEDTATGLVRGVPCGLRKGLDKAVSRIQDISTMTWPIPVDVFVIEEAVGEKIPFLRVEVRPTMPPHYDGEGRRPTRQGRSTRPLSDDELLRVYLDRESGSFAARFRHTSAELQESVGALGTEVGEIADAIDRNIGQPIRELTDTAEVAASAASGAESAASDIEFELRNVKRLLADLQEVVEELRDGTTEALPARVAQERRRVWWAFSEDTWARTSRPADRLAQALRTVLSADITLSGTHNAWELRIWEHLLSNRQSQKKGSGTLKWWEASIKEVEQYLGSPGYQAPALPDLRAEIRLSPETAFANESSLTNRFRTRIQE